MLIDVAGSSPFAEAATPGTVRNRSAAVLAWIRVQFLPVQVAFGGQRVDNRLVYAGWRDGQPVKQRDAAGFRRRAGRRILRQCLRGDGGDRRESGQDRRGYEMAQRA